MHLIAHLVVHLTNQMFVGRIQMQMFKVRMHANALNILWRHLNAHSNAQHSNVFAFVNKPGSCLTVECK